jgi:hypothetical protein
VTSIIQLRCTGESAVLPLQDIETLASDARGKRTLAFMPERMRIVADFADKLVRDPLCKRSAPLQVFAFWTRRGAIEAMRTSFVNTLPARSLAVGRGIAFHLPPANVDTIFLYSWVVAFLGGNVNVTRLPSVLAPEIDRALDVLLHLIRDNGLPDIFVRYSVDEEINAALSRQADLRFVWGGDEKVRSFERLPLRVDGRALVFPDRYSYGVIDGETLSNVRAAEMDALAKLLFNDIFTFGQMACSSPHVLYVVCDSEKCRSSVHRLLHAVDAIASARDLPTDPAHGIEKFVAAAQLAGQGEVSHVDRFSNEMTAVELASRITPSVGGGFMAVSYLHELDELADHVETRDQTLGYFGFTRERMETFGRLCASRGLCRIVPIGQSLNFDTVWDGYDLLREAVRLIRVL